MAVFTQFIKAHRAGLVQRIVRLDMPGPCRALFGAGQRGVAGYLPLQAADFLVGLTQFE